MAFVFHYVLLFGLTAVLLAPLAYAVATLRGMRHRRVYPLLRGINRDGNTCTVTLSANQFNLSVGEAGIIKEAL